MSFFKALGAGIEAFGNAYRETMEASRKNGSAQQAYERLSLVLRVDRAQCQTALTPETLEAIRADIEKVVPEIVRRHTDVTIVSTRVMLGQNEENSRSPVLRAEFDVMKRPKAASSAVK